MAVAYADAEDAVEPVVLWRCRLEHRIDAEVVARGIDALTAIDPSQHIGGAMATKEKAKEDALGVEPAKP